MKKIITILAIETSCDETAASVLQASPDGFEVLSDIISTQVRTHAKYGGIIPEIAARMHIENMIPIVNQALKKAKKKPTDIDAIAVTGGPGLITSLLVGVETAKSLSVAWNIPLIKVNHIEAHICSSLVSKNQDEIKSLLPALALVVSGGHTELILMNDFGKYKWIGGTRDDAVGEAFDKVAKMLKLGYPGGPAISALAEKYSPGKLSPEITLPRPMINTGDFEMSFSGIKTSVLYNWNKSRQGKKLKKAMAHEFQEAVTDVLVYKTASAIKEHKVKSLLLGGGVAANKVLRRKLENAVNEIPGVELSMPEIKYTGDNAVMIGVVAYFQYLNKDFCEVKNFRPDPNWEVT